MMPAEEGHGITAAVGVMARVQAQRDPRRVGLIEEGLDLIFILDVGLGVRVEDERQPETLDDQVGDPVGRVDQAFPGVLVEPCRGHRLARE